MAAGRVFHWKHGWIPLDHSAMRSKDERLAASRVKNADRDTAKEQRLAAHRAATAAKDADRRIRYLAAQNRKHQGG